MFKPTLQGLTDDFATISLHLVLFTDLLFVLVKSIPVHSLMLSFHPFFYLPLIHFPFTVLCRIVVTNKKTLKYGQLFHVS